MLWYKSLSEGSLYCGFTNGPVNIFETLYNSNKKDEFQNFLANHNINYKLEWQMSNGYPELMVIFPAKKKVSFNSIASTGEKTLLLYFYYKIIAFDNISLLFIDDFDYFFHYDISEKLILELNSYKFQSLITLNNTYLMQNRLTRPDCCYIISKDSISNLHNLTNKEIREAHNLEKMYLNKAFKV